MRVHRTATLSLLPYLLPHTALIVMLIICVTRSFGALRSLVCLWFLLTVIDAFLRMPQWTANKQTDHAESTEDSSWTAILLLAFVLHMALLFAALDTVSTRGISFQNFLLITTTVGIARGMFAISAAHEMMHRTSRLERIAAQATMQSFGYLHFRIEHLYDHHVHVGTHHDPATARLGESFYTFYLRSIPNGLVNAWRIQERRLERARLPICSVRNELLVGLAIQCLVLVIIGWSFGPIGIGFFLLQGLLGQSNVELINYIQHYGLQRRMTASGRPESIKPIHSWDSNHCLGNWFLFNLPRHSDHHCNPWKPVHILRSRNNAPQLPMGYLAMFWLALCPPLWRRVMNPKVESLRRGKSPFTEA